MGVSSTTNTVVYNGDGTSTSFSFPYYFFRTVDLYVYLYDTISGVIAQKVLGTDYSISGTPDSTGVYPSGANVVFVSTPTNIKKVVISRFPIEQQNFQLITDGIISSVALVHQFDYLTLLVQSLQDQINRCIQLPPGFAPTFNVDLPSPPVATYNIGVNASNNGLTFNANVAGPVGPQGPAGPTGPAGPAGGAATVASVSSNTTISNVTTVGYVHYSCDATSGAFNVTLPAANLAAIGQVYNFKKLDNTVNNTTILVNGTDQILLNSLVSSLTLNFQGKSYSLICRAVGFWDVI